MTKEEIEQYITTFISSNLVTKMQDGVAYYNQENTAINKSQKKFYSAKDKCLKNNPFKSNHKLYSGFFKVLVDQKVGYSINGKMSMKNGDIEAIETYIKDFINTLQDLSTEASIKTRSILHFYINKEGAFRYKQIPAEQIIPIYDQEDKEKLLYVIRFYSKDKTTRIIELYDDTSVKVFQQKDKDLLLVDSYNLLQQKMIYGDQVVSSKVLSWGRPPFAIMYSQSELDCIKSYVDLYDIISSDFANNICDFQDVFLVVKNFIQDSENLGEVIDELRNSKGVAIVGDDTGVDIQTIDIPVNARETMLKLLESNIYKFGMGVNADDIKGNITNVRIKALYSNLDLKANKFETSVQKFWGQCLYFVNKYLEIKGDKKLDFSQLVFNRAMILNEVEMLQANAGQIGVVSEKTRLANHRWVSNVKGEINDMEKTIT